MPYTRRHFVQQVGSAAAVAAAGGAVGQPARSQIKPNIIYIMADDLGQYDLGCCGQENILTPHIDQMAAEGLRFTDCYAGAAVCAPARSCLMTGQHAGHTRVRNNSSSVGGVRPQGRVPLLEEDVTVAEVLKQAGYKTGITGKWGLGEPNTTGVPNRKGFDEWYGFLNQRHAHTYYPEYIWRNQEMEIVWGNMGGYENQWIHDDFTRFGLNFIRDNREEPFFLYMAYTIPHGKYEVPDDKPYSDKDWPDDAKKYSAMVTRLDADVGAMLALLKELDIDDRTIVFFCSDNGATFTRPPINSAGPLREKKGSMYEGGIRVPMIARWPGRIASGRLSDQQWAFCDFMPTAAELAGTTTPEGIDGVSVVPALLENKHVDREFLYWETPSRGYCQAVRQGPWKAVRIGWGNALELYNLDEDIGEKHNLADKNPQLVAKMEGYMKASHTESELWPVPKK